MKFITNLFIKLEIYYQFTRKFFRKNKYFIPTFSFKKPKKNKVLIYNIKSKKFAEILFKKKNLTYYYADFRNLNLYIFFYTIKNSGIKNFKKNYKFNFFNFVKPKIIYTAMDNYLEFYLFPSGMAAVFTRLTARSTRPTEDNVESAQVTQVGVTCS